MYHLVLSPALFLCVATEYVRCRLRILSKFEQPSRGQALAEATGGGQDSELTSLAEAGPRQTKERTLITVLWQICCFGCRSLQRSL